jgi:hypothetical protein
MQIEKKQKDISGILNIELPAFKLNHDYEFLNRYRKCLYLL